MVDCGDLGGALAKQLTRVGIQASVLGAACNPFRALL